MSMEIVLASSAGFCFGVRRAVKLLEEELEKQSEIYSLGEIIHNRIFVSNLEKRGVKIIDSSDIPLLKKGSCVFIRTHGVEKGVYSLLEENGLCYTDATCPYVKKTHTIVENETKNKIPCIIFGDSNHPEVKGIRSHCEGESFIVNSKEELSELFNSLGESKIKAFCQSGLVMLAQTTSKLSEWEKCSEYIKKIIPCAKIFDTICRVTEERQNEVRKLASVCCCTVVVGSPTSSNTIKLYETAVDASGTSENVFFAESGKDISGIIKKINQIKKTKNLNKVAVTAGASTPSEIIQEVISNMTEQDKKELSFEEMLDQSFKSLRTGERVTGIISSVSQAEIQVDLGIKHTGILPYDEVTAESNVDLVATYKVGDPIEVIVSKFNDVEGTVQLSKKRIDMMKLWEKVKVANENDELLIGVVKDINKGGVEISYGGLKVFVPASRTGVARGGDLNTLKGKEVRFKIREVDEGRKRLIGGIIGLSNSERKKEREDFINSLVVGQKFVGEIKSIMSYGIFVAIGPAKGMVHISELFWKRLRPIADYYNVGDKIEVYIKGVEEVNGEKRISLGYKTEANNPWAAFKANYNVGDVVDVKIVSLKEFGAFAEILPEVDGLIHKSQIGAKTVANPATVLSLGDVVKAQITAIDETDENNTKISLSMKALLSEEELAAANETYSMDDAPVVSATEEAAPAEAVEEAPVAETAEAPATEETAE